MFCFSLTIKKVPVYNFDNHIYKLYTIYLNTGVTKLFLTDRYVKNVNKFNY